MTDSSNRKALKAGFWYTIGNFIIKGIGFLTMPIFTRIMTPEDVGLVSNFTSWTAILITWVSLDLYASMSVARFDYQNELEDYSASILVLGTSATFTVYLVALLFKDYTLEFLSFQEWEFHLAFSYFLFCPALQIFQVQNNFEYKYKTSVAVSLSSSLLSTVASLICVFLISQKWIGRILGLYIPMILINCSIYFYILRNANRITPAYWKYALKISLPLVLHSLASSLLGSSDKVMIQKFCGSNDTAMYSVAYSCGMIVSLLWKSINTAWATWSLEKMNAGEFELLKKASRPLISFFFILVSGIMLVAPEVLWLMGGDAYRSAVSVIPPVMVGYVFCCIYTLYVNIETYVKRQDCIAIGTVIAAITNIMLNWIFIPKFGYTAAAYTTLIGYFILFLVHFLFVWKMNLHTWYDTWFNFCVLAAAVGILFLSLVLYQLPKLRHILIGIAVIICFSFMFFLRKELLIAIHTKSIAPIVNKLPKLFQYK